MREVEPIIKLDSAGIMRVGKANIRVDEIVDAHQGSKNMAALQARFPSLSREEIQAAIDHHLAEGADAIAQPAHQRDANWRKWNAALAEDLGTDTPPNSPIEPVG